MKKLSILIVFSCFLCVPAHAKFQFGSSFNQVPFLVVDQTDNQACTSGCSGCLFGIANASGADVTNIVSCSDATADLCVCAGVS